MADIKKMLNDDSELDKIDRIVRSSDYMKALSNDGDGFVEDEIRPEEAEPAIMAAVNTANAPALNSSSILICGKSDFFTKAAIKNASSNYNIIIAGTGHNPGYHGKKIHWYDAPADDEKFSQLFDAYDIGTVWYISGYVDGADGLKNELNILENILKVCAENTVSKLIVVSSVDSLNFRTNYDAMGLADRNIYSSGKAYTVAQMENIIRYYSKSLGLRTIILRAPYVYNDENKDNYLGSLFEKIINNENIAFPYHSENKVDFLSENDLVSLLTDITEENADTTASYTVISGYHHTWRDLEHEILKLSPNLTIAYENQINYMAVKSFSVDLKRTYGFIPIDNAFDTLSENYLRYRKNRKKESVILRLLRKIVQFFLNNIVGYIELILFFLLSEFLVNKTGANVYFRFVDIRLFYVLLMGTTYGTGTGLLAGLLACVGLYFGYQSIGVNGTMLFYNIENWLPFVIYLMTGSITGYISKLHRQENEFLKKENEMIRSKYEFLHNIYKGAIDHKGEYKRQILGYKDSFGVIFKAVSELDSVLPQDIFMNAVLIMERILENHTIAIYAVDDRQIYGRLVACSSDILETTPKSIAISSIIQVFNTIKKGENWKNTELLPEIPMYAYGITEGEKVNLIIALNEAAPEQTSLYYMNLFGIVCNLIKMSFIRALEYQKAIEWDKYYPDSQIVVPKYFKEIVAAQEKLSENGLANYVLMKIDSSDRNDVQERLNRQIRRTDIIGTDDDGNIYLLLTQVNMNSLEIVSERLKKTGLGFEMVNGL